MNASTIASRLPLKIRIEISDHWGVLGVREVTIGDLTAKRYAGDPIPFESALVEEAAEKIQTAAQGVMVMVIERYRQQEEPR